MSDSAPTPENVAGFYDELTELLQDLAGGRAIHLGYRPDSPGHADEGAAQDRLTLAVADRLHAGPGSRILDIGCGTGQPALLIAKSTGAAVTGISISKRQVAAAQARDPGPALVEFGLADALDLPFPDESFDAACMIESLVHMPDDSRALAQARRCLRPGGTLVIADLVAPAQAPDSPLGASGIPYHIPPTLGQLTASLKDGGLEMVQAEDFHSGVLPSIEALLTALDADHPGHRARLGADRYNQAITMLRTAAEALPSLIYILITARRPS
jgi:ubiquinone/menaquinone biosynthesis C-methylase UbiE